MTGQAGRQPQAVCDANGRRWRVEGAGWVMQPVGTLTAEQAEAICRATASALAAPDSTRTGQVETEEHQIGDAIREIVRRARVLCGLTDDGGDDGIGEVDPAYVEALKRSITALEAFIPSYAQPTTAEYAVTMLVRSLKASRPAAPKTASIAHLEAILAENASAHDDDEIRAECGITFGMMRDAVTLAALRHANDRQQAAGAVLARIEIDVRPDGSEGLSFTFEEGIGFADGKVAIARAIKALTDELGGEPTYQGALATLAARPAAPEAQGLKTFPQPHRKDGEPPCGECHLKPGETCDICGAVAPSASSGQEG